MTAITGFVCAIVGAPSATPAIMAAVIINVFILIPLMQTRSPLIGALFRKRVGSALRQRHIGDGEQLVTLGVNDIPDAEDGTELVRRDDRRPGRSCRARRRLRKRRGP